jgi:hypothetical protein
MATAVEKLRGLLDDRDLFEQRREDLVPLWIQGLNERLEMGVERIPVVRKLVDSIGLTRIASLEDVVPLLLAHTNYKSYPAPFIAKGRWDGMNTWLGTLSSERVEVDVAGVVDQDEWLARLHAAGHMVLATSGTSGKNSFLPNTRGDAEFSMRGMVPSLQWVFGIEPRQDRPVFFLSPKYGPTRAPTLYRTLAEAYGRPDARFFLTEQPLRLTDMSRLAELRKKMADGTAKPSEIAAHERAVAERAAEMQRRLDALVETILEHRREPMIIAGFWAQFWTIVEAARRQGLTSAEFHPETVLVAGGGTKGANLPPDHQEQILGFFGVGQDRLLGGYGMSELSVAMPRIGGRYRPAPWIVPLLLDREATTLVDPSEGATTGRFAFFDLALEGRWGGHITGDQVEVDISTPSWSISDGSVRRFTDLGDGDDKLTCAGTIDAFVRGML